MLEPKLLYSQEVFAPIDIIGRILINGSPWPTYGFPSFSNTLIPYWEMPSNPIPYTLSATDAKQVFGLTGLDGQGFGIGSVNGSTGMSAIVTDGLGSLGFSISPRAVSSSPFNYAVVPAMSFANPPIPFAEHQTLQAQIHIQHPYTYIKYNNGTIRGDGVVFYYLVLQFVDINTGYGFCICVRLFQDKYAVGSEAAIIPQLSLAESYYYGGGGADTVVIDAILSSSSLRITPCAGSGSFALSTSGLQLMCFTMSASPFSNNVAGLNASRVVPGVIYSTNPADYKLTLFGLDAESWAPINTDPRMAFSFYGMQIQGVN